MIPQSPSVTSTAVMLSAPTMSIMALLAASTWYQPGILKEVFELLQIFWNHQTLLSLFPPNKVY